MSATTVPTPARGRSHRLLTLIALVAVAAFLRERGFAKNRERFGSPHTR